MDTKKMILQYIEENGIIDPFSCSFSKNITSEVSHKLHISRTLSSQYLNELHKEKKLIKIISRPVLYLSTKKIIAELNMNIETYKFEDIDEYKNWYQERKNHNNMIGFNGSLLYTISQIKSGLLYPDNGLPILLCGKDGSGKKYMIDQLVSYYQDKNQLSKKWKVEYLSFINVTNANYVISDIHDQICKKSHLLFYLYHISSFPEEEMIKIIEELLKYKEAGVIFNFIVAIDAHEFSHYFMNLEKMIPIVSKVPSLSQRPVNERKAILTYLLKNEFKKIKKEIYITTKTYDAFVLLTSETNISTLKKTISQSVASAYAAGLTSNKIVLQSKHLPNEISSNLMNRMIHQDKGDDELDIYSIDDTNLKFPLMVLIEKVVQLLIQSNDQDRYEYLLDQIFYLIRSHIDEQMKTYYYEEMNHTMDMQIIKNITKSFEDYLNTYMPIGFTCFVKEFCDVSDMLMDIQQIQEYDKLKDVFNMILYLKNKYHDSYLLAENYINKLSKKLNLQTSYLLEILFIICIENFNKNRSKNQIDALIISHGASTATSISDTANFILGRKIFTSMDMPLNISIKEIALKVNEYLQFHNSYTYILILVDMGSLNEISKYIKNIHYATYGIINNVSTSLALQVGQKIINGTNFFDILEDVVNHIKIEYKIVQPKYKNKAIIVTSDLGQSITSKISQLFHKSLPSGHPFTIIEFDYDQLKENGTDCLIFKEFDVTLLIKPDILLVDNVAGVSLEDVIYMKNCEILNNALNQYLTQEQIEVFHMNLLKNFTLENVVENLTILNARHLMDLVVESVEQLSNRLHKKIEAKDKIGIYMHICFLVERLVTKNEIQTSENSSHSFYKENRNFILIVRESFLNLLQSYHVDLPISEIMYLHKYLYAEED